VKVIQKPEFETWAAARGLRSDERYADPRRLVYFPYRNHARFWVIPRTQKRLRELIGCLLEAVAPSWTVCMAWPRTGRWISPDDDLADRGLVRERRRLWDSRLPFGQIAAVEFHREDVQLLIDLAAVQVRCGWSIHEDMHLIPDPALGFLETDHHDVIHVSCADEDGIRGVIREMADHGFALPDEPPDDTFKVPNWMGTTPRIQ